MNMVLYTYIASVVIQVYHFLGNKNFIYKSNLILINTTQTINSNIISYGGDLSGALFSSISDSVAMYFVNSSKLTLPSLSDNKKCTGGGGGGEVSTKCMETCMFLCLHGKHLHGSTKTCAFSCISPFSAHFTLHYIIKV